MMECYGLLVTATGIKKNVSGESFYVKILRPYDSKNVW